MSSSGETFTGSVRLTIIEATGLKPTTLPGGKILSIMDPYSVIDFDDIYFGKTGSRPKTCSPVWGETMEESVEDAQRMQITVFHSSTIPPDPFIAHAQVMVSELMALVQQGCDEHEVRARGYPSVVADWSEWERVFEHGQLGLHFGVQEGTWQIVHDCFL